jgi:hypothetical protein
MTFYTNLRDKALALLTKYGQTAYLRSVVSVYDPDTGGATLTNTDTQVVVVVLPLPREYNDFSQELVEMSKNLIVMSANELAAASIEPSSNDKVMVGSIAYDIVGTKPIAPAGVAVVHKMLVNN